MMESKEKDAALTHFLAQRDILQQIKNLSLAEVRKFVDETLKEVEEKIQELSKDK